MAFNKKIEEEILQPQINHFFSLWIDASISIIKGIAIMNTNGITKKDNLTWMSNKALSTFDNDLIKRISIKKNIKKGWKNLIDALNLWNKE